MYQAQEESKSSKSIFIKGNAVFLPVGMLNTAAEFQISSKYTLQPEIFISPWKSFTGKYAQLYMAGLDGRYYFRQANQGWYIGANISFGRFIWQKWNYWSDSPFQFTENSPVYKSSDLYQDGFSFMIGAVGGYQFSIHKKWKMDVYLGGGNSQDFYRGYHKKLGIRYDDDGRKWNRSGEWIPYKGGVMISYQIR